ncbi:MAG: hypothetical protein KME08_10645 [Aphanothece sp. CMT-3BRIN-NPC111]|jgi:hypothetical protein|nr:hypothetical protein [Aphanothece sp. CMT-3BRIN-NPC111]
MDRLFYEKSVSYKGYLIIPKVFQMLHGDVIYSYTLLSELGHKGTFHKLENPAGIYSVSISGIIDVAKQHLDDNTEAPNSLDIFKCRYIYRHNLIIIYQAAGKYYYDHYKPDSLSNVAAPKIFTSEQDCINWIKQGLDSSHTDQEVEKISS